MSKSVTSRTVNTYYIYFSFSPKDRWVIEMEAATLQIVTGTSSQSNL